MSRVTVKHSGAAVRFQVRLQPRASRTEIVGVLGGALRDGAANDALIAFLADQLAVPRRGIRIVTGATSRMKTVEVEGVMPDDVERLTGASDGGSNR